MLPTTLDLRHRRRPGLFGQEFTMFLRRFLPQTISIQFRAFSTPTQTTRTHQGEFELNSKEQADLERRKIVLYELAQKDKAIRETEKLNEIVQGIHKDFPPCMHAYNILLKTHILTNDTDAIRMIIEKISKEGFKPNAITYSLLISYYRNHRKMDEAVTVFERMKATGVKPNGSIFTTLIAGFAGQGNFSQAEAYFKESQQCQWVKSDLHLLNTMISCYLAAGRPEDARRLASKMLDDGLKPNHVTYKVFLIELLDSKNIEEAARLYDLQLKDAPGMRPHDHGDIAARFFRAGDSKRGLEIFEATMKKYGTTAATAFPFAVDQYSHKKAGDKIEKIIQLGLDNPAILSLSCHSLLRHFLREQENQRNPVANLEAIQKIKTIMDSVQKAGIKLSPRIELKCTELIKTIPIAS